MARPLRWLEPGTAFFVTVRCIEARFLLRPDPRTNDLIGYWLARASRKVPGVRVIATGNLSNHIHLLVVDDASALSEFMGYFLGNLAKAINELRERSGPVWHRRFSAEPVLDDQAMLDRLVYLLANPIAADLVAKHDEWPGLLLWAKDGEPAVHTYEGFDAGAYHAAVERAAREGKKRKPKRKDFVIEEKLVLHPLTTTDGSVVPPARVLDAVRSRERVQAGERARNRRGVLGLKRVLARDPFDAPRRPKRSPRPLCHTSRGELWAAFKERWKGFCRMYRAASEALRRFGELRAPFPDYSFPPWRPLVRPPTAALLRPTPP